MTLISALETRLKNRLGLASTVTIGDDRVLEAINAGVSRAYADGVPGLTARTLSGFTVANVTNVVASHTANTSALTMTDTPTAVSPGDTIELGGDVYLIYTVNRSTKVIDVGMPILASQATVSGSIVRRSVTIPDSSVYLVMVDGVEYENNSRALAFGESTGEEGFAVGYDDENSETYVNLVPDPGAGKRIVVMMRGLKDKLASVDSVDMPEAVFDAILERSREAFLRWSGDIGQIETVNAQSASTDTDKQLKGSGTERGARVII